TIIDRITDTGNPPPPPPPSTGETVTFPLTRWQWEPESAGEVEEHTPGHHDFWFESKTSTPFNVRIHSKSCTCSSVSMCYFSPEEKDKYLRWLLGTVVYHVGQLSTPRPNFGIVEPALLGLTTFPLKEHTSLSDLRGMKLKWYKLEKD